MKINLSLMTKVASRSLLIVQKYSPELLLGAGVAGFVGTNVLSSRASMKLESVLVEMRAELDTVQVVHQMAKESTELSKEYSPRAYKMDLTNVYLTNTFRLVKLYAPAFVLGSLSIAALVGSHKILKDRNVALMAAYQAVSTAYGNYREYVRKDLGEDADRKYAYGITEEEVVKHIEGEDGTKKKEVTKKQVSKNPSGYSPYARWFDAESMQWSESNLANLAYLRGQQHYLNDLLRARGHVFLNEVYDALGIPRSKEGAVVGWVLRSSGDGYIDFGLFESDNPGAQDFINGWENQILLDFNVDGVIYDKI